MIYSTAVIYALAALVFLAQQKGMECTMARDIAKAISAPPFFLAKILQTLARNGILFSLKGPTGGFRWRTSPDLVTLSAVAKILDGADDRAVQTPYVSDRLRGAIVAYLQETTITDLVRQERRARRVERRAA